LNILLSEDGQDIAEYAMMAALMLVVMMATIRLIGANASNIFSQVGSAIE
jgi:Flp pilus assembly pilin Flp